jgi:RNA polymerase sigma-70 factor (ECF subfamily)
MELEQVAPATVADARPQVEDQFIERLKKGDAAAFEKLVNERSGEIYGLLYRLTENSEEARDLTQETFLRAFQSINHFRGESDLRTWIYRIAINQARNRGGGVAGVAKQQSQLTSPRSAADGWD